MLLHSACHHIPNQAPCRPASSSWYQQPAAQGLVRKRCARRAIVLHAAKRRVTRADEQLFDDHLLVKDVLKEMDIKQRRRIFTFERWAAHRSTSRYLRHILGLVRSSTFLGLSQPMLFLTAVATGVCCYEEALDMGMVPGTVFSSVELTDSPFQLTSFALALLLVFRTDNSYARWLSALETWTEVKNTCKTLVRNASFWVKDRYLQKLIARWTVAYSKSLMAHVRDDVDIEAELKNVLFPHELAALRASSNYPQFAVHVLTALVNSAGLTSSREDRLTASLQFFEKATGTCEQLLRYPIPLGYTRHTSRFMVIWLCFLPFALWDECHWAVIPIVAAMGFLLLGIEEIGVTIEEPFTIMPLEDVCSDICVDVQKIIESNADVTRLVRTAYNTQAGVSSFESTSSVDIPDDLSSRSVAAKLFLREQDLMQNEN